MLALPVCLGLSACQTVADSQAPIAFGSAPPPPLVTRWGASTPRDGIGGAPLLANARGGPSTIIEGSGRFVGEPPTGSISRGPEHVADSVRWYMQKNAGYTPAQNLT
jgi:general secretion pathway protein D